MPNELIEPDLPEDQDYLFRKEAILRYFVPPGPPNYNIDPTKWRHDLEECLDEWGCDWLEHFMDIYNPIPAHTIELLCFRCLMLDEEKKKNAKQ